ncbi:SRPBCC family protein [Corallococcus terminator]|uniref:ATPase n=1 Tax=Corallococcus terminator TaxID=2316733 RepID=A0A3A8JT93_9BACT|nr:SRPBCC family protein [Corallococcus terminator]RKG93641.1 ATPase [Corallococcus terminator]
MAEARSETPRSVTTLELKSDREVIISRTFRAPARIVFDAWTKPEFVKRWWAPQSRCVEFVDCQADVRVGGAYRYHLKHDGNEFSFYGTYSEITPHTRLAYTQIFEPFPDAAVQVTVTFEERDGKTHLVSHEVYPSKEAREGALSSGMEHGLRETMDQLDELVASLT